MKTLVLDLIQRHLRASACEAALCVWPGFKLNFCALRGFKLNFCAIGRQVVLASYQELEAPANVKLINANRILPEEDFKRLLGEGVRLQHLAAA